MANTRTTYSDAQIGIVDKDGNTSVLYPYTKAANVTLSKVNTAAPNGNKIIDVDSFIQAIKNGAFATIGSKYTDNNDNLATTKMVKAAYDDSVKNRVRRATATSGSGSSATATIEDKEGFSFFYTSNNVKLKETAD